MSRDPVSTHIPGALDWRTLAERADAHRPRDPSVLAAELRRLHATGLTARDIASATRVPLTTVHAALGTPALRTDVQQRLPFPLTTGVPR